MGSESVFSGSTTKIQSNSAKLQLLTLLFVAMSCVLEPRIGIVRKSLALGDVFQHPPLLSQAARELAAMIGLSNDASVDLLFKTTLRLTLLMHACSSNLVGSPAPSRPPSIMVARPPLTLVVGVVPPAIAISILSGNSVSCAESSLSCISHRHGLRCCGRCW